MQTLSSDNVHVVLAVWGARFIDDFLNFNLLSLLAPGNVPLLANTYKTTFVVLTRSQDVMVFEASPAFQKLRLICDIEFVAINDLIMIANHSTTLTHAYDRAVRRTNDAMLQTYFIFLTADYIMADGSFRGLMRYMAQGCSGICAGNFQVLQNKMTPFLKRHIDPINHVLQISPRALLKKSFQCLHPVALASFFDENHLHNYQANRFFLRHDAETLAGRFYLLHMLCIKPETTQYQVGASCDYSFIPEMCPSGNVAIIDDSDDYLVIEAQPVDHELSLVRFGAYQLKKLAAGLSEWTTARHRENAKKTIYYHVNDLTQAAKTTIDGKLNRFVLSIATYLDKTKPRAYRNHPYWIGAARTFDNATEVLREKDPQGNVGLTLLDYTSKAKKWYHRFFGCPPSVFIWHHRWLEYKIVKSSIARFIAGDDTIVFFDSHQLSFMQYGRWLEKNRHVTHQHHLQNLSDIQPVIQKLNNQQFERCLFFVELPNLKKLEKYLTAVRPILAPHGKMLVVLHDHQRKNDSSNAIYDLKEEFLLRMNYFNHVDYHIQQVQTIHNTFSLLGLMTR